MRWTIFVSVTFIWCVEITTSGAILPCPQPSGETVARLSPGVSAHRAGSTSCPVEGRSEKVTLWFLTTPYFPLKSRFGESP